MVKRKALNLALVATVATCSCVSITPEPAPVPFETIAKVGFSGLQTATNQVVKTEAQWSALWKLHSVTTGSDQPPVIDFEKSMVIVTAMGQQRTGGYSIEITRIIRQADALEVYFRESRPEPGRMSIQALTAPVHIVKISKSELPVKFRPNINEEEADE